MREVFWGWGGMCLDKRLVAEWFWYCSAYFTKVAQSHNFDGAFPLKLAICHLQCKSTWSRCIYASCTAFIRQAFGALKQIRKCFFFLDGDLTDFLIVCRRLAPLHTFIRCKILNYSFLSDVQLQLTALGPSAPTNKGMEYHIKSHLLFQLECKPRNKLKYKYRWYSLK